MAVYNLPNYTNDQGFGLPLNIRRGNPNPLDNSSVWASLEAAQNYAATDPIAYVGQVLTVVDDANGIATVYSIQNEAGTLEQVGTSPVGDESTITVDKDGKVSLYGIAGLELTRVEEDGKTVNITYQPLYVNGKLTWVEPSVTTVEDLALEIGGLKSRVGDLETIVGDAENGLVKDVAANAGAIEDLVELIGGDVTVSEQIGAAIENLKLADTYAAKVHKHVKADITDFAHNHEMSEVNGLVNALAGKQAVGDYATKAEAQAMADAKDNAIAAAQKAGDDAQADVNALAGKVGTVAEGKTIVQMISDAKTDATYDDTKVKADIATNAKSISDLEGLVGDKNVAGEISNAVAAEALIARAAEKANADAIAILNGNSATAGSVDKKVADAINAFATQVSDDQTINTFKELIEYAATHNGEFAELVGEVDANTKALETLNGAVTVAGSVAKKIADAIAAENLGQYATDAELNVVDQRLKDVEAAVGAEGSVADAIEAALTAANGYTDGKVKGLADGAVAANTRSITDLEELVGDKKVSTAIEDAITALKIGDYAKALDLTNAINQHNTDKIALEGVIALKANDKDLATVAKTGNIKDLVQTEGEFIIFDCGSSASVI